MSQAFKVTFQPDGKSVSVLDGTTVFEAAARAGIILTSPCGGKATCGKCRVEITAHAPAPTEADQKLLPAEDLARGARLACQCRIHASMVVNVPHETRFFEQKILEEGVGRQVKLHPNIKKRFVKLPTPTLTDQRSDLDRVMAALREEIPDVRADIEVIRTLPDKLREDGFAITAVLEGNDIISFERGNTTDRNHGVAFDIGTTTVVGMLVDLTTGAQLAVASRTNPQVAYGDDVVSRITYCHDHKTGLELLQSKIAHCLDSIIAEVCTKAKVARETIYEVTVVGNTTMNHIFLKVNPWNIAQAPYVAVLRGAVETKSSRLGITINETGNVYALPNIAGFVGADTVGVILATDLLRSDAIKLAIDIGTNGELALGNKNRLVSCSCAAGPAFEGARIQFGMRATAGAIEKVLLDHDVRINVIGNVPPRGLCGTAVIDAVAEMLRVGIVDPAGRVQSPENLAGKLPEALLGRIVPGKTGCDFVLAKAEETKSGQPILLTQRDVRELQLAKGAIFAGIQVLKNVLGVTDNDIAEVLLAGAFGNFIRRSMAKRIGLLPDIPTERIKFVGNAAGAGARMALIARECREEAERISTQTEYIELGGRPDFQQEFMMAMMFPEK